MPTDGYEQDRQSVISLFLRLLHPAVSLSHITVNKQQLQELWNLGLKYNVAMLIYSRLRSIENQLSEDTSLFLAEKLPALLGSVAQSARQEAEEKRLLALLQAQDIDACIIKGNEIARQIYGDPNSRSCSDIDMLVREGDIHKVDRLLVKEGYERGDKTPLIFWLQRMHHAAYFSNTGGQVVEMHWSFGIPSFFDLTSDDIWADTEKSSDGRIALLPEMQVIQALMHHHMHTFREVRALVDLLWIFHVYANVIDWPQLAARLQNIGLKKIAQITLHQLISFWGESADSMRAVKELGKSLKKICRVPKFLTTYFQPTLSTLPQNPSTPEVEALSNHLFMDKLMMRLALDRTSTIWYSLYKSFSPSPALIKSLYGDSRNRMLPYYYFRFLVWRLKDWLS